MRQTVHSLLLMLVALSLVAACSHAAKSERNSQAPPPPAAPRAAPVPPGGPGTIGVIPGHPPVTTSGVVANFEPDSGLLTFVDGRAVKITDRTKVFPSGNAPRSLRPGDRVVVQDALPVGVRTASTAAKGNKNQRMGTVRSVDTPNGLVVLTDGNVIHVAPAASVHVGTDGAAMVLADLRPGDELRHRRVRCERARRDGDQRDARKLEQRAELSQRAGLGQHAHLHQQHGAELRRGLTDAAGRQRIDDLQRAGALA